MEVTFYVTTGLSVTALSKRLLIALLLHVPVYHKHKVSPEFGLSE